ncbi:MAG: polyribonucleotide nucleotidyltransferase, partial [Muribaculaceae bacterium]|nr:polyribonucleotide nucleotidyltransferase [Muribaculaceae bacterium]
MVTPTKKTIVLGDGREITLETGKLAKQADGAVELRMNNTMILATVVSAKEAEEGVDLMPLQVEYKEKYSSVGRYPGGFTKREGRASDNEILTARLVDRVLRPLFPANYHANTFVNLLLFSSDGVDQPDALAGLAASAAIAVSDVPLEDYISEVRVARINGEFVINPTFDQMKDADMDLMVGATYDNIMMVEGEMDEVGEDDLIAALKAAHDAIKPMCVAQKELAEQLGVTKREYCHEVNDEELRERVRKECYDKCYAIAKAGSADKQWRNESFDQIKADFIETIPEEEREAATPMIERYYHDVQRDAVRRCILDDHIRLDGRKTTEIRPITCWPDYLPGPHGSAVF